LVLGLAAAGDGTERPASPLGLLAEASEKAGSQENDDFCTREKTSYIKAL
jgi:hypothetical protein